MTPAPFLRIGVAILALGIAITVATSPLAAGGLSGVVAGLAAFAAICGVGEGLTRALQRRADRA